MTQIILEKKYKTVQIETEEGEVENIEVYLGMIVIYEEQLTLEVLESIKNDEGWDKYRKILKDKGFDVERV